MEKNLSLSARARRAVLRGLCAVVPCCRSESSASEKRVMAKLKSVPGACFSFLSVLFLLFPFFFFLKPRRPSRVRFDLERALQRPRSQRPLACFFKIIIWVKSELTVSSPRAPCPLSQGPAGQETRVSPPRRKGQRWRVFLKKCHGLVSFPVTPSRTEKKSHRDRAFVRAQRSQHPTPDSVRS